MKQTMMRSSKLLQAALCLLFLVFTGCESQEDVQPATLQADALDEAKHSKVSIHYGPATAVGEGTARVWVQTVQGKPVAIGIEMTDDVLEGLPMHGMPTEYTLRMPGQAHATGIKTVTVGWNPMGHDPIGVYSLPHFDFHFYMQTMGQIMKVEGGPDPLAFNLLTNGIISPVYTFGPAPFAVPHMGVHWSDINSPEFGPEGFSRTFIYGSYRDKITFLEPMITLEYLLSLAVGESEVEPVVPLLIHEDPGYYPETYTVSRTATTYSVALTDLEWHNRHR